MALLALSLGVGVLFAHPTLAGDFEDFARTAGFSTQDDIIVIIARLIRTAITMVGVVAVVFIIFGGFMWMTAGGNPDRLKKAKSILTNAIIGLLIVFSSFAIVQFVLNSLVDATSSTITQTDSVPYTFLDSSGGPSLFYLQSVNTDCASALQNLELQFVFSKNINKTTVGSGIVVSKVNGGKVAGTFDVSGRRVTFTPSSACTAPNATLFCFDALTPYQIQINQSVLKSSSGSSLTCNTTYPCNFSFTTGSGVDTHTPVVGMDTPDDGQSLYAGAIALLQSNTSDDTGVSTTDFYVVDDDEAVFTSGLNFSTARRLVGGNVVNPFYTDVSEEWDTNGYMTNESYDIWSRGVDCAGNHATSAKVEIILRAASCNNDVTDTDLGETEIDCGGEDTSGPYYCGACAGGECEENSDCAAGHCENGFCVVTPRIDEVSPGDGAVGNLITISGEGFGIVAGQVVFLGSSSGADDKTTSAAVCNDVAQWADGQIIVAVPQGAIDGPIMVRTGAAVPKTDSTNNDYGPTINFDVNAIVRPGICELDPVIGVTSTSVSVYGNGFGATQGSSTFYFTDYEASSYMTWGNGLLSVAVPNVDSRLYRTQVFTGDFVCVSAVGLPTTTLCEEDSDCNAVLKETCATSWCSETLKYCDADADCGNTGGDCVSVRVGSNKVRFDVLDTLVSTTPTISSIETGWKACLGGDDAGERCAVNADCSLPGLCEAAPNWGPPGQYVTIYGTNFGTGIGTVRLRNDALGYTALASVDFPDACEENFWHDTYVTVIVPEAYSNLAPIQNIAHSLTLTRSDSAVSEPTSFVVLNDVPGPAMCRIDPSAGPAGIDVKIYGDHFGGAPGSVEFYDRETATVGLWGNDEVRNVDVPADAQTGPVVVNESVSGYASNPINFEVGDCRDSASLCLTGTSCCFDGSCSASCETFIPPVAHYAYRVSTGITPLTPKVVVECTTDGASPTPWEGWSLPEDICLNSQIEAEFDMAMKQSTLNSTTILVHACTDYFTAAEETADLGEEGQCQTWTAQTPSRIAPDATGFSWIPGATGLSLNTLYRVTIDGKDSANDTQAVTSLAGGLMSEDFTWQFTTRNSSANCKVGDVNVRPAAYLTSEQGVDVAYTSQLVAANDMCVALSCAGYKIGWDSDFDGAEIATPVQPLGVCTNTVDPIWETPANDPAIISAEVLNSENHPSGEGELTIDFTDPEVAEYFPSCTQACVNVLPWARFNVAMNATTLTSSSVKLYQCQDSLCARSELPLAPEEIVVVYDLITDKVSLVFPVGDNLLPDTWYRVVLSGGVIKSATGNPLSDSGSNYGTDENRYFANDFSWKFKTKDSNVSCSIDSVEILPEEATLNVIGERQEYSACAYGAPDACSVSGQALQASSYAWSPWTAADTPNVVAPATGNANDQYGIVAYMIANGAISISSALPASCASNCLNAGAPVTITQGVCGNDVLEPSEECDDGGTESEDGCSATCLNEGKTACSYECEGSEASCVNDNSCEEICEEGVCSLSEEVCLVTSDCPFDTGDTCEMANAPCCGDGVRTWSLALGGEDCDDGNTASGDGCSSVCKNEGSRSVDADCGDDSLDWESGTGGEDCDDHNTMSGDGCSSSCLKEGSLVEENVYAICGNGGLPQEGEDCDDGNAVSGDGCSSACLNEGRNQCVYVCSVSHTSCTTDDDCLTGQTCGPLIPLCCGNSVVQSGEDCDGGMNGEEGCSTRCLFEGSSVDYSTPSFCGDGNAEGIGEECDALSTSEFSVGPYSVAQVATGAPQEVNATTGYATSHISVVVGGKNDTANLTLQCACSTDTTCGNPTFYGCGENACCFARPMLGEAYPPYNIGASGGGYCRNTAVWVEFSQDMDEDTFKGNLYLELLSINGNAVDSLSECPAGYTNGLVAFNDSIVSPVAQLWGWMKSLIVFVFAQDAQAQTTIPPAPFLGCYLPVSYNEVEMLGDSVRVHLLYNSLLVEGGIYELNVLADNTAINTTKDGVLSANQAVLCLQEGCTSNRFRQGFYVGSDICDLDRVSVEDMGDVDAAEYETLSPGFFSTTGEEHLFTATPQTLRSASSAYEEISPLAGNYDWTWSWTSSSELDTEEESEPDTEVVDVVSLAPGDIGNDTSTNFEAVGNDGKENVIATATITTDTIFETSTVGGTETGLLEVTALVCENPWPGLSSEIGFPYRDTVTDFSFYYCRDAGEDGTQDDLPSLGDPIDVTSFASAGILQELIFKVDGTSDAIGVRVLPNGGYLSPAAWVEAQGFTGSFTGARLDGYEAVQSGTTLYAASTNQSGSSIYPNIYVVSYNENAGEEASEIFARALNNWRFNANDAVVTDINLCAAGGDYITKTSGEYLPCSWDGDCFETCQDELCTVTGKVCGSNNDCQMGAEKAQCDAQKAKLTRDMKRLTDITNLTAALQNYGEANGHCSVTKGQSCDNDNDCFGEEECVAGFPDMQSGTFVPALTNSAWDSWNAVFGNALGSAPAIDPINEFYSCDVSGGYDPVSCWNGEEGVFVCLDRSHVYGYQSVGGEEYKLYAQLESSDNAIWNYDIDTSATDEAVIVVEYPFGYAPSNGMPLEDGFEITAEFCNASPWGTSALCGDGTRGSLEDCEIGYTNSIICSTAAGLPGRLFAACLDDCSGYQDETTAEAAGALCVPYTCGNGIVETNETYSEACDDGALNGTYGHCDNNCLMTDAYYCGDGYLAGGEQCDCGITGLYNYTDAIADDSNSWAYINSCDASNGQWTSDITTSCSYDCREPGPSCGDGIVNGGEGCDGGYEEWEGKLCDDGITTCVVDSDCDSPQECGGEIPTAAAGVGDVCADYVDAGEACTTSSQCESGACEALMCTSASDAGEVCFSDAECLSDSCPDFNYDLFRYRTCTDECAWDEWNGPVGGTQICGNGIVEGAEVCDDGNSSNNDGCLNTCVENICGDDFTYLGVESCDDGDDNGEPCEAPYGGTCNYCSPVCQYKTMSGGYCGDGTVNGGEVCDGEYSMVLRYFDSGTGTKLPGTCSYVPPASAPTTTYESNDYTCRWLGVCNGGSENGEFCTLNYDVYSGVGAPDNLATGDDTDDTNSCMFGKCVPPACADGCGTSCPIAYETTGLFVQSGLPDAYPLDSIALYSYMNDEGDLPDNAALFIPACSVATQITADVSKTSQERPNVDIVFVTDLSFGMNRKPNGSYTADLGARRINMVADAMQEAIPQLFDAYSSLGSEINIGLVSYSSQYRSDFVFGNPGFNFCNSTSSDITTDGAWIDQPLSGASFEAAILSDLGSYEGCVTSNSSNASTIYKGIETAEEMLNASVADVKIIVITSGTVTSKNDTFYSVSPDESSCSGDTKNYLSDNYSYVRACYADIVDDLIDESEIVFYSVAITTTPVLQGLMAHLSSNVCDWDESVPSRGIDSITDCSGSYALSGSTIEDVTSMYGAIADSIVNVASVTFTINSTTTTGGVQVGNNVVLPFPDAFACQSNAQTIPMRSSFFGGETVEFSDLQMMYCPY
jgi:cysteine-rich repeat protein